MDDLLSQLSQLSPAKQLLLQKLLRERSGGGQAAQIIPRRANDQPIPLTFAQHRLWLLSQMALGSPAYNMCLAVRLAGPLATDVLRRCLDEVVRRHSVLRTTFAVVDGNPIAVIAPELRLDLALLDLRLLPTGDRRRELERLVVDERQRPFDLARGPLVRAAVIQVDEQDYAVLITMHHIVSDGWSMEIVIREIGAAYGAYVSGRAPALPELPIQYADFACWQQRRLQGDATQAQLAYWQQQLSGLPPLQTLPFEQPQPERALPSTAPAQSTRQPLSIPLALVVALQQLSRQTSVTLFMVLLAAFKLLLYRYTRQADVVVGSPVANRTHSQTESLIGCFINTLVLRSDLGGNPSVHELLLRVRDVVLNGHAHQEVPFEMIVEMLQPKRELHRPPLFRTWFVLNTAPSLQADLPGLAISPLLPQLEGIGDAKYDLKLDLLHSGAEISGFFEYKTELFSQVAIRKLADQLTALLELIAAHPEKPIESLVDLLRTIDERRSDQLMGERKHENTQRLRRAERKSIKQS